MDMQDGQDNGREELLLASELKNIFGAKK